MRSTGQKRLLKLAGFLEKLPKERFNFASVVEAIDERVAKYLDTDRPAWLGREIATTAKNLHTCGTIACALGWCPVVFRKDWEYNGTGTGTRLKKGSGSASSWNAFAAAEEFFGLTAREAVWLFSPCDEEETPLYPLPEDATAAQVAANIRLFVKNNGDR